MPAKRLRSCLVKLPHALAALYLGALFALPAIAEQEEPWYQIEAIVFAHTGGSGTAMTQRRLDLSYPGNWHQLIDPDAPESLPELDEDEYDTDPPRADDRDMVAPTDASIAPGFSPADEPPTEEPFVLLPSTERRLSGQLRALERSGGYRVLYHAAWRQPLDNRARTSWLLIRGGDQFGDHQELEGSLRIYMERALFAQVNLWQTRFVRTHQDALAETSEWPPLPHWPARFGGSNPLFDSLAQERSLRHHPDKPVTALEPDIHPGPAFSIDHIAALNQTQRLELGDILYLDHPSLGVLVQVTRYERPTTESDPDLNLPNP